MESTVSSVYDCVDAFSKLLDIEYEIVLGRKMQSVTLRIEFRKTDLHHQLESIFDDNKTVYRYNERLENFSLINAEYLLKNEILSKNVFAFLSKSENEKYFCRSFFPQERIDYSIGQTVWTLLYKKKIYKKTGEEVILFDRGK